MSSLAAGPVPGRSRYRRNVRGTFARRSVERLSRQHLVFRAGFLPEEARLLMLAHLERGVRMKDLAAMQKLPVGQVQRRLRRLRDTLSDPAFLLAARFGGRLPAELRGLAARHWIEGQPLRELARAQCQTIHVIRGALVTARALLLLEARSETEIRQDDARRLLEGRTSAVAEEADAVEEE